MKKWLLGCGGLVLLAVIVVVLLFVWIYRNPMEFYEWSTRRTLVGAGFDRHVTDVSTGSLTWFEAGSGPALVFLHGAGDQSGAWCRVAPEFIDDHRVLVLDMPGHGESEPSAGPLPLGTVLEGVDALLQREAPDGATLVGNSMGAWIAMLYAERRPSAVERVVAVNGGAMPNVPAEGLTLTPKDRAEARRLMQALRDPSSDPVPDFVLDAIVRRGEQGPIPRLLAAPEDLKSQLMDEARLAALETPVDLVWGPSDGLMTLDYAHTMAGLLPRARLTTLTQCGHIPQNECPEHFAARLDEVLRRAPPAPRASTAP